MTLMLMILFLRELRWTNGGSTNTAAA